MKAVYYKPRNNYRILIPPGITGTGSRQVRFFDTKEQADAEIRRIHKFGLNESKISEPEKAALVISKDMGLSNSQILEAVQHYKKTVLANKKNGATVEQAALRFLAEVQSEKNCRTLYKYRSTLRRLTELVGPDSLIVELTSANLNEYLDSFGPGTTRRAQYANVKRFLNWSIEHGYLEMDPLARSKPKDKWGSNRKPLGVDEYRRILFAIAGLEPIQPGGQVTDRYRRLLGFYVLGGLAGMRRCEIISSYAADPVIQWSDINWKKDWIHVRHEVAKETQKEDRQRWIPIEPAAGDWLRLIAKSAGPVVEISQSTLQRLNTELLDALRIRVPDNGLRNGYATYGATFRSKGELAKCMGDLDSTIDRYYIERHEPDSGRPWFEISPNRGSKVIPFVSAVA